MKTRLVLGAAAVLSLAGGQAHAAGNGYVGAAYIESETDIGPAEIEEDGWAIEGATAFKASPRLSAQLGASFADSDDGDNSFAMNGHLNSRNSKRLIGAFAGVGEVADDTFWAVGAEGELYKGNVTLAGAVGYGTFDDSDTDTLGLDGEIRYFASPNFRIDGEVGFSNIDSGGGEEDATTFGVGAEYQLASTPFSIFGGLSRTEFDEADDTTDTFSIGGRLNFGGTLRDRDRKGASLPGLSQFTRPRGV
jgi:hypothetical protein